MSSFIEVIETFEIPFLTSGIYKEKINGLVKRFPRFERDERYRIVFPYKDCKTADDYVSMKFGVKGRVPVYGIYNNRDLELISVCVKGTLFAIDDCNLDPNLVPDLQYRRVNLGIRHSSLAVSESLSYTKNTISSAVSTLSLNYTSKKKDEWTDAFVLLKGITTQAVRFTSMLFHVSSGFYKTTDAAYVPFPICLSFLPKWRQVSKAVREGNLPYSYKYYDIDDDKIYTGEVSIYSSINTVQLIDDGHSEIGKKFQRKAKPTISHSSPHPFFHKKILSSTTRTSVAAHPWDGLEIGPDAPVIFKAEPILPGCFLRAKEIGLMPMIDQGEKDDKIIAVCGTRTIMTSRISHHIV